MRKGLSWLQDYSVAYCVTFARELDKAEMLRRFNADLSLAQMIRRDDGERLEQLDWFGEIVQAGQSDGWAFVYEDNGFTGTFEDILQSVSAGTVAISVFCNVNSVTRFCYAEDGVLLAHFDPIDPPFDDPSPKLQSLLRQARITRERYEQGDDDFMETLFTLAQVTGVSLKRKALVSQRLLTTFLRNPVSDFLNELFTQGGHEQQTVSRLLTLLAHPEYRTRLLRLLEYWQQPECWQAVAERVDRALEVLHSVRATDALLEVLKGEREAAIQRQEDESSRAVTEVLKALIRFDQMHDQQGARARLLTLITASEPEVVRHAALALGRLGDQQAVEPLVRVLALSPHEREAIQLLGQMQAKDAIEPLVRLLDPQSEDLDFQLAILEALVQIGEAHIAEQLVPLVHPETQWALFETLEQRWKTGPSVLQPAFRSHVGPASSQEMMACAFQKKLLASLGRLGNPRIVEALLNRLTPHAKFGYRGDFYLSLLDVLGTLGDKRAIEPLARLLTRQLHVREWHFQQGLVRALRQLGDTRAELEAVEEALQQLAEDYHRQTGIWLGAQRPAWLQIMW